MRLLGDTKSAIRKAMGFEAIEEPYQREWLISTSRSRVGAGVGNQPLRQLSTLAIVDHPPNTPRITKR
jgi:hypothetical protein